ncbi:MFS transporter [Amycolatopsis sp. QT-25]|uniref:DHA2 family efflux MFS transporter permease subunit n=1 Tax=Amycolatopsis sp. QT-25 TaxID=3034022 RepID=UPI0023EDAF6E|nr:MFS transporter [Amycolatopsis sp. QT-25]WET76181.1 MFS transporter [Amycolatopsis sp. QT-25]
MSTESNEKGLTATSEPDGPGLPPEAAAPADPRRWRILAVLGLVQFMLILDVTVVNIALPRIQDNLGFSGAGLAWVVNGYVVMAGGLLLLGGRLADVFGRRRLFLIGVVVFAAGSIACGAATNPATMIAGRVVQGVGEALTAPAALGLIALMFTDAKERGKAFGIWGGLAGLGGVTGSVISGALVDLVSWRWIFFINLPVAVVALVLVPMLTSESRMTREHVRLDFSGAIVGTLGLGGAVYGLLQVVSHSWASWQVLLPLLGGLALLGAMVAIEARSSAPLIPLSFFGNRTRLVANVGTLVSTGGFFTYSYLLTLFEQQVLHYSPLTAGLSYLPFGVAIGLGIGLNNALMPRLGVRVTLTIGFIGSAVGLFLTGMLDVGSSYAGGVLPGMIILGMFTGVAIPASTSAALHEVDEQNSSLASAVQNVMQQIGAAVGIACLVALALTHATDELRSGADPAVASASGLALSFWFGAAFMVVSAGLVLVLLGNPKAAEWGAPKESPAAA